MLDRSIYFFVLLPPEFWNSWEAWKENLLLSRFAAPTSAGILFTMLAAIGLKSSWIYKKIQVLAIFDDLDTILLMIPRHYPDYYCYSHPVADPLVSL